MSHNVADDEEYARKLQAQYDREQSGNQATPSTQPSNPAANPGGSAASAPFWRQRWDQFIAGPPQEVCSGCQKAIAGPFGGSYLTFAGKKWHPGTPSMPSPESWGLSISLVTYAYHNNTIVQM